MEDGNNPPPPIPDRPGRPVRIQSIDTLKPESRPNDYVDTTTITAAINTPKLPPKIHKSDKPGGLKNKLSDDIEQHENVTNERREHFHGCKHQPITVTHDAVKSPELPPRKGRAPPLPPRTVNNFPSSNGISRQGSAPTPSRLEQSSFKCNSRIERHRGTSIRTAANPKSNKLQPSVLILPSEQSGFSSRFPTLRRQEKAFSLPVTQQPQQASNITLTLDQTGALNNTIICRQCGRCRCSHCTGDRQLPERWLCEGNCRCSADSVVDTLSCMCCVKSCFKSSCIDNPEGARVDPCSCTDAPKCLVRWTALAALSLCLPCLCCYWPMQLGVAAATACYNSSCCRNRGCNCEQN